MDRSGGYTAMRRTSLMEMYIVRYVDDFRIFCRTKTEVEKVKFTVTQWLSERLTLEVSPNKTRVVNVKCQYSEFLEFIIKLHPKGHKLTVSSHMSDKALKNARKKLVNQVATTKPRLPTWVSNQ